MSEKTKEIIINNCYGGFSLSPAAIRKYAKLKGFKVFAYANKRKSNGDCDFERYVKLSVKEQAVATLIFWFKSDLGQEISSDELNSGDWFHDRDVPRDDVDLIQIVRSLKTKADGSCAKLKVVEIPADVDFEIQEYDGHEWIAEKHRTWN